MAKWGEGDERWRVEDLGEQGRNVNSWHWEESDVLPWCKSRLNEILKDIKLVEDSRYLVVTTGEVTVTGDAIINRRKGKVIPAYELEVTVKWKGQKKGVEDTWEGEVKAPYISEENHDEDPELRVSAKGSDKESETIRSEIVNHGRPVLHKIIAAFVKEPRAKVAMLALKQRWSVGMWTWQSKQKQKHSKTQKAPGPKGEL